MAAETELLFQHHIIDPSPPRDPHVKAVGDIDGDGHPDVITASSADGPLVWYRYPDWSKHVVSPSGAWSCDAKVVDMDGDGDGDILISEWYTEARMEWFENPLPDGDPTVDPWRRHVLGPPRAHDIKVGDIDGDGQIEIVTRQQGDPGNEIVIRKQIGDEWQLRALPCPAGEGLAIGDLTGNGCLDIIIGGRWYEAPSEVLQGDWHEHAYADWSPDAAVQVADVNGDGRLDIVLTRSEGPSQLSWFTHPGDVRGEWRENVVDDPLSHAHSLAICDVNGDGLPDIVTAEMHQSPRKRVLVYLNEGNGANWRRHVVAETGSHDLCVAGIGTNGRLGIVGANWSGDHQPLEFWELAGRP